MERLSVRACIGLAVAAMVGILALLVHGWRLPDLEIRTFPWRTHLGPIHGSAAPGQVFRCERDGLHRIDVAVTKLPGPMPSSVELVLREGGPQGPVIRRVAPLRLEAFHQGGWLRFELEPLADSARRELHFELRPLDPDVTLPITAWARFRGMPDSWRSWGEELLDGPTIEGSLLAEHPDLRGLAFAFRRLEGPATLTLLDAESGTELRTAVHETQAPVVDGWVMFGFEALPESRFRSYAVRLDVDATDQVRSTAGQPSYIAFFGSGEVDPRLGGMTLGTQRLEDRDLVFRTWTRSGPVVAVERIRERMGWRAIAMILAWLSASAVLMIAMPVRRR